MPPERQQAECPADRLHAARLDPAPARAGVGVPECLASLTRAPAHLGAQRAQLLGRGGGQQDDPDALPATIRPVS